MSEAEKNILTPEQVKKYREAFAQSSYDICDSHEALRSLLAIVVSLIVAPSKQLRHVLTPETVADMRRQLTLDVPPSLGDQDRLLDSHEALRSLLAARDREVEELKKEKAELREKYLDALPSAD